jgi:uncharacterized protein YjbI with pentapeptide repeats
MIKYAIYNWIMGNVLFTAKINAVESDDKPYKKRLAVLWAIEKKKSLAFAHLQKADLSGVDLSDLNFYHANCEGANFEGADCQSAYFCYANMIDAITTGAVFKGAYMQGAILDGHDVSSPEFKGAIFDEGVKK